MGMTLRISHTPTAGVQQPSTCGSPYVDVPPEVAPSLGHIPGMVTGSSLTTQPLHSQVQATVASGRSKGVPKRKSLAGLFGLAMKKSFIAEDTSGVPPLTTTFPDATSISWGWEVEPDVQRRLRPLLAKTEKDVGLIKPEHKESPPYRSRFGGNIEHFERNLVRGYGGPSMHCNQSRADKLQLTCVALLPPLTSSHLWCPALISHHLPLLPARATSLSRSLYLQPTQMRMTARLRCVVYDQRCSPRSQVLAPPIRLGLESVH